MRPSGSNLLNVVPWLAWVAGALTMFFDPLFGPPFFVLAAMWVFGWLLFSRRPVGRAALQRRLRECLIVPIPAIGVAILRLTNITDVEVILVPFYLAPAVISLAMAVVAMAIIILRPPAP